MSVATMRFTALDTLFFKESRPFETIGGSELASLFPPPPRTVAGAIRTAIGDSLNADWHAFRRDENYTVGGFKLRELIGYNEGLGRLSFKGIWLVSGVERLYPAPLYLLHKDDAFARLRIDEDAVQTHLGRVRLPAIPKECEGFRPVENLWLTRSGMERVLAGNVPASSDIRVLNDLYDEEPRLGIARNNHSRTVFKGLLYQSRHIRPKRKPQLYIETDIAGLGDLQLGRRLVRLGAEGRMAGIERVATPEFPAAPASTSEHQGVILTLLTPARFKNNSWLPDGFLPREIDGVDVWQGTINNIRLTIRAAVTGKAMREGGWDMAKHAPRPAQSLIPAGSAWYCTVDDHDLARAVKDLHQQRVGEDAELGRGLIACGLWDKKHSTTSNRGEQ